MIIVSSREFRANQGKYLGMAAKGEDVVLQSRGNGSFKITPITSDDTLMSKEVLYAKIDRAVRQFEEGKVTRQGESESVGDFVKRLLCTD